MKRKVNAATAALLVIAVASASTAGAATKKKKAPPKPVRKTLVQHFSYSDSESVHPVGQGCIFAQVSGQPPAPCWPIDPPSWARYMSISSSDATTRPTPITMYPQSTGVSSSTETFVCGAVHNSTVARGDAWTMSVDLVSADASCPGAATTGTITVTFSNLP